MKQIRAAYCQERHNTVPLQYCVSHYNSICLSDEIRVSMGNMLHMETIYFKLSSYSVFMQCVVLLYITVVILINKQSTKSLLGKLNAKKCIYLYAGEWTQYTFLELEQYDESIHLGAAFKSWSHNNSVCLCPCCTLVSCSKFGGVYSKWQKRLCQ